MRSLVRLAPVLALIAACKGGPYHGEMPPPGTPLTATIDDRPFVPRGITARVERDDLHIYVFERLAPCGTPGASPLDGDRFFQVWYPAWTYAANGTRVDLWNARVAVNTAKSYANGGSATAMSGAVDVLNHGPTGGAIMVDAQNGEGRLVGQLPFSLCP